MSKLNLILHNNRARHTKIKMMETTNNNNQTQPDQNQPWQISAAASASQSFKEQDDDDKKTENNKDEETDAHDTDWGTVDPQEHPGRSSGMDPSGPGSAV